MIVLSARDLSRQFDVDPVFRGVTFDIRAGEKIGIVGPNGAGKSTLLKILARLDEPDTGSIETPASVRVGILQQRDNFHPTSTLIDEVRKGLGHLFALQQRAHDLAEQMASAGGVELERLHQQYDAVHLELDRLDAYHVDHRVDEVLQGLGFTRAQYERPLASFSGGQQNRALLARLLLEAPDVLLLDEPTNHLDIATTEWLEDLLARSLQAVVVVSHDRYFLDKVTSRTLEIFRGGVQDYPGNFSHYWSQRAERTKVLRRTWEKQQEYIAKTEEFIRRNAYGQKSAQAKDREKKLQRLELVDLPPEFPEIPMGFTQPERTGDWVLRAEGIAKSFPAGVAEGDASGGSRHTLFSDLTLQIDRGDRVGILGPNGSGKTTLVRILIGELDPDAGSVRYGTGVKFGYCDQQLACVDESATAVEAARPADDFTVTPGTLRSILARFGIQQELALQTVGNMSGGERTKVALARLAAAAPNVLILDEPTNHLDFWACAALEKSLREFTGTVLFVSHDRYFVDQVATKVIVFETDRWRLYEGNYSAYKEFIKATAGALPGGESGSAPRAPQAFASFRQRDPKPPESEKPRRKRRFPYRKVDEIEAQIAELEAHIAELEAALADPEVHRDGQRSREIQQDYALAQEQLEELLEHWEEALELN